MKKLLAVAAMTVCGLLVVSAEAKTCTWKGGTGCMGADANWEEGQAPEDGDTVVLLSSDGTAEISNDLDGLSLAGVTFSGSNPVTLKGNGFTLAGDITDSTAADVTLQTPVVLAEGERTLNSTAGGKFYQRGGISGPGALKYAVTGTGPTYCFYATNTYAGVTTLSKNITCHFYAGHSFGDARLVKTDGFTFYFRTKGVEEDYDFQQTVNDGNNAYFRFCVDGCAVGSYTNTVGTGGTSFQTYNSTASAVIQLNAGFTVKGDIENTNGTLSFKGMARYARAYLKGSVHVKQFEFDTGGSFGGDCGTVCLGMNDLSWTSTAESAFRLGWHNFVFGRANQYMPDRPFDSGGYSETGYENGCLDLNGFDQTMTYILTSSNWRGPTRPDHLIKSSKPATLTLRGTKSSVCDSMVNGSVSIAWCPTNTAYVQTFSNRVNTTTGTLTASGGVLRVAGEGAKFANVPTIDVQADGAFEIDTRATAALKGLTNVRVGARGRFEICPGCVPPFSDGKAAVRLAEDATFAINGANVILAALYVGDGKLEPGLYTGEGGTQGTVLPQILGTGLVTVEESGATCTWSGRGDGVTWSSGANWEDGAAPENGDSVILSAPDGALLVNDIDGLRLASLTLNGGTSFAVTGKALQTPEVNGDRLAGACVVSNDLIAPPARPVLAVSVIGGSLTLAGVISGNCRIETSGGGQKHLAGANTFTGGVKCLGGFTFLENAQAAGPAGSAVTLSGGDLWFNRKDAAFVCDVVPAGSAAIRAYESGTLLGTVSNGTTTAGITFGICDPKDVIKAWRDGISFTFEGKVDLPKATVYQRVSGQSDMRFDGGLVCKTVSGGTGDTYYGSGPFSFGGTDLSEIGQYDMSYGTAMCRAPNAFSASMVANFRGWCGGDGQAHYDLNGFDQTINRITGCAFNDSQVYFDSRVNQGRSIRNRTSTPVTLTLKGSASAETTAMIDGPITLVWDAEDPSYVQMFSNLYDKASTARSRINTMSGDMIASNGVLRIGSGSSFANVPRLATGPRGRIEIATEVANAFGGVTAIDIAPGGRLVLDAAAAEAFPNPLRLKRLSFGAGSSLALPGGLTVVAEDLIVDGAYVTEARTFTSADFPQLAPGVTVVRERFARIRPSGSAEGDEAAFAAVIARLAAANDDETVRFDRPVEIEIMPGQYRISRTLSLPVLASGSRAAPVVWRAAEPGTVRILGGPVLKLEDFTEVTDPVLRTVFPSGALPQIRAYDLSDVFPGEIPGWDDSFRQPSTPMLMLDTAFLDPARWPNAEDGWAHFTKLTDRPLPGGFLTQEDRAARWDFSRGVWLYGYWHNDWSESFVRAETWLPDTREMVLAGETVYPTYGVSGTRRYFALNLPEELDAPGEWWIDRAGKTLYFIPPAGCASRELVLSTIRGAMFQLADGLHDMRFENLEFACGATAVSAKGSLTRVTYESCSFRGFTGSVLGMGGTGNVLRNCRFEHTGGTCHGMGGGNQSRLEAACNVAEGCVYTDFSHYRRTTAPAINAYGCGQVVTHCTFSNAPHMAIGFAGGEHFFAWNDFSDVLLETDDAGCLYGGKDTSEHGIVIAGNRFRKFGKMGENGTTAVYFDDCQWGGVVLGNRFEGVHRGILVGSGELHFIQGNYFTNCAYGISIDRRGMTWDSFLSDPGFWWRCCAPFSPSNTPWSAAYPLLVTALNDQPGEPWYNEITGNVFVDSKVCATTLGQGKWTPDSYIAPPHTNLTLYGNWTVSTTGTKSGDGVRGFTHLSGTPSAPAAAPVPTDVFGRLDALSNAPVREVASPDGNYRACFALDRTQRLCLEAWTGDQRIIEPTPIGLTVDGIDTGRLHFPGEAVLTDVGERREMTFPLVAVSDGRTNAWVEAYADAAGFAYRLRSPGTGLRHVAGEVRRAPAVLRLAEVTGDAPEGWGRPMDMEGEVATPWRTYCSFDPVIVDGTLVLDVPADVTRGLYLGEIAALTNDAVRSVVKTGRGTLVLDQDLSGYTGPWFLSNGVTRVTAASHPFGSAGDAVVTVVEPSDATTHLLAFEGDTDVERPLRWVTANRCTVRLAASARVRFLRTVVIRGLALRLSIASGARAIFCGGYESPGGIWSCIGGSGEMVIRGVPAVAGYMYLESSAALRLECAGNSFGTVELHGLASGTGAVLAFAAEDALSGNPAVKLLMQANDGDRIESNGHSARCGWLSYGRGRFLLPAGAELYCERMTVGPDKQSERKRRGRYTADGGGNPTYAFLAIEGAGAIAVKPPLLLIVK